MEGTSGTGSITRRQAYCWRLRVNANWAFLGFAGGFNDGKI